MDKNFREIDNIIWQAEFQRKKNWIEAVQILKHSLEKWPDDSKLNRALAETYEYKNLYRKAIKHFQKVINNNSSNDNLFFHIANCFLRISEYLIAIEYYEKIEEYLIEAEYNKAIAYYRIDNKNESLKILKKIVKDNFTNETPYFFLIELLINKFQYKEALSYINKFVKKSDSSDKMLYMKGFCHFKLQNYLKAYVDFVALNKNGFDDSDYFRIFGLCCSKINKHEKAIVMLKKSIEKNPFSFYSYIDIINILIDKRKFNDAKDIISQAITQFPDNPTMNLLKRKIEYFIRGK